MKVSRAKDFKDESEGYERKMSLLIIGKKKRNDPTEPILYKNHVQEKKKKKKWDVQGKPAKEEEIIQTFLSLKLHQDKLQTLRLIVS